jgi:putative transposase
MHNSRETARLSRPNYLGQQSYFVTICCDLRRAHLADHRVATRMTTLLHECVARQNFQLHAYCLMPDHLHLLAEGTTPHSNLRELVRVFKLRTAFEFRQSHRLRLWEMSYHDHILRRSDALESVACYIWQNPVRKQLCNSPQDFPFSGSQTIPWMQRAGTAPTWSPPWKP